MKKTASKTNASGELWPKGVSKPAQRALRSAGYSSLDQLDNAREADLAALHGIGPEGTLDLARGAQKAREVVQALETPSSDRANA